MKVKELIERLKEFDGELEIGVEAPHNYAEPRAITYMNVRDYADPEYLNTVFIEYERKETD